MFDEYQFQQIARQTITLYADKIEDADQEDALECEIAGNVLTITSRQKKVWVISKHTPSKQLWLASPISGGLHFDYRNDTWQLTDGRALNTLLAQELCDESGVVVSL